MLKLLIADDDKPNRDLLINILNSNFKNQFEIIEARNGREVIELSDSLKPDIILTDINLSGINGLAAIHEIRKIHPNTYIMILTSYDYFNFAVEAIKENVKEYILKPFNQNELIKKITQAIAYINLQKDKRKNEVENQEKLYNLLSVLENELSFSIINNALLSIDYETYMNYLNLDFKTAYSMVVSFTETVVNNEIIRIRLGKYISQYLSRKFKNIASYTFTKDLVYFIQNKKHDHVETLKVNTIALASDIEKEINKEFHIAVNIGIGKSYHGIDFMHKSYEEACISLEHISNTKPILHFLDIGTSSTDKITLNEKVKNIDKEKIALFNTVKQYIIDNIDKEIDLENISKTFNLSHYYFCRTFKEMLGYNFSDYINIVRIDKAKQFLKADSMSVKEICYSVGYSDPNYFSKVFKKYEGVSPTEYKLKII
jgi:two-component system response regulator YesN